MCIRDSLYSQPFSFPSLPPLLLITARESGERYSSPPACPGGARPPNAFLCHSQSKICASVKSFTPVHNCFALASRAAWTLPALPSPLLCPWASTHRGKWGQLTPYGKMDEKLKSEDMPPIIELIIMFMLYFESNQGV